MSDGLNITDKQRERFRELKADLKDAHPGLPKPSDDQVLKGLLDTWDAVEQGHYTEGYTENNELRELERKMRRHAEVARLGHEHEAADLIDNHADELEALIDDNTQDNE